MCNIKYASYPKNKIVRKEIKKSNWNLKEK